MRTGNPLCVRRGREGAENNNKPGNLRGRGREGARTPNSHADLPSTPFSVQAGKEWSVRGKDHVTRKPWALCADLLVPGRLKYTYLTSPNRLSYTGIG